MLRMLETTCFLTRHFRQESKKRDIIRGQSMRSVTFSEKLWGLTIKWKISRKNINSCTNIGKRNRVNCVEYEQNGGKKKSRNEEWILSTFSAMSIHVKNFVWPNRNVQKYRVDQHTILQIQSNSRVTKTSNASLRT